MERLPIGEIIHGLRKNKGITQEKLAELLDVSTPAVSKWESGQAYPDLSLLPIIARYFNVSIDCLLGFSNVLSEEEIAEICRKCTQAFEELTFDDAIERWSEYIRLHPTSEMLKYQLACLCVTQISKAGTMEKTKSVAEKIIKVFEQCTSSDNPKIHQGAYYQMGNLYILLEEYDKAQAALNNIPTLEINPKLLKSLIFMSKGNFEEAMKNIQQNIFAALTEILFELRNYIQISRLKNNDEWAIHLLEVQKEIGYLFGLEGSWVSSACLEKADIHVREDDLHNALVELEKMVEVLKRRYFTEINDTPFFKNVETMKGYQDKEIILKGKIEFLDQNHFDSIRDKKGFQNIISELNDLILKGRENGVSKS